MERKRRMRGYIVVCLLFALLMSTGCTSAQQDFSSEERPYPDENMTVIGVSQLGSESMWRSANTASIQQVFTKENGYFLMYNTELYLTAGRLYYFFTDRGERMGYCFKGGKGSKDSGYYYGP